jgi:hypothetical protein
MRKDAVGGTCRTHEIEKCMQKFSQQTTKKDPLGKTKLSLEKQSWRDVH